MEILIKAGQLILSLSILVVLHELGHFIPAKLFKTKVEKFYLFFDPWFSLFKIKRGETEYGIGWLPLGGYVKIAGMIDESMDKEQLKSEPQPWEFRAKPAWQRLIIMLGGVTVNILLAIVIFAGVSFVWGEKYLPSKNLTYGIMCDSSALNMGLQNGDVLLAMDGTPVENFEPGKILSAILIDDVKTITVERNGDVKDISIPATFPKAMLDKGAMGAGFISARIPFEIAGFASGGVAKDAGIELKDRIIGLNETPTPFFDQFKEELQQYKGKDVSVVVLRNGDSTAVSLKVPETGLIGVMPLGPQSYFEFETKKYGLLESIPAGIGKAYSGLTGYIKQFKLIFNPEMEGYKHVGGFMTIGNIFPSVWDWQSFWNLTAFLSIMLAFMNILPIPALDGGHAMFTLYEIITRRKPSEKFLEYAQVAGMVLLIGVLLLANGNDLFKFIFK